jgi:hypothetical protein
VAIVTLAVAIGANAAVFSVLNALILHPLNLPDAESLYEIQHGNEASLGGAKLLPAWRAPKLASKFHEHYHFLARWQPIKREGYK